MHQSSPPSGLVHRALTAKNLSLLLTFALAGGWFFSVLAKLVQHGHIFGEAPVELKGSLNPLPLLKFASLAEFGIAVAVLTVFVALLEPLYRGKALQYPLPDETAKRKIKRGAVLAGGLCFAANLVVNPDFRSFFWLAIAPWAGTLLGAMITAWSQGWRIVSRPGED